MASPATVNVMLAVQEKKTVAVDVYGPLRQYIAITFSEREAQANEDDLEAVRQMRSDGYDPCKISQPPIKSSASPLSSPLLLLLLSLSPPLSLPPSLSSVVVPTSSAASQPLSAMKKRRTRERKESLPMAPRMGDWIWVLQSSEATAVKADLVIKLRKRFRGLDWKREDKKALSLYPFALTK